MRRIIHLYMLWWAGLYHRLRHDLGRELSFAVAAVVLMATFFYVFNDFLNVQVASLSPAMRQRFAQYLAAFVLLLGAASSAGGVRREAAARRGVRQMANQLGERRATLRALWALQIATWVALLHGAAWYLVRRYLMVWSPPITAATAFTLMAATVASLALPYPTVKDHAPAAPPRVQRSVAQALYRWRLRQMLRLSRSGQACMLLAAAATLLTLLSAQRGAPLFVAALAALASAYLLASSLVFQMSDDLASAWTERGAGVSHDRFMHTYTWLGLTCAAVSALSTALCYLAGVALQASPSLDAAAAAAAAAKVAAVALVPGATAPVLLLQIDGRRPALNLLLVLIVALFIATAVFASWLGLLLIPLLSAFAQKAQAGRFYRA